MRLRVPFAWLACCLACVSTVMADADAVVGVWETEPDEHGYARIEIVRSGATYVGKIAWLSEPRFADDDEPEWAGRPKTDRANPDPQLRQRPIVGLRILDGLEYVGGGQWKHGRIYDPSRGKTYRCQMKLVDDTTLRLRGFIGVSLFGRGTTWLRTTAAPPSTTSPDRHDADQASGIDHR